MQGRSRDFPPRRLTADEAAALDFLVGADFPGAEELRQQAAVAQVVGDWGDCCPSIFLAVDQRRAPRANVREPIPVEAESKRGYPARELLLFVEDGWLKSLELVHYEEQPGPRTFPDPSDFSPPWWDAGASGGGGAD